MSTALADARADLAGLLSDAELWPGKYLPDLGLVYDTVPEEPFPPCVILQPGEDYIAEAQDGDRTFANELLITYEAIVLVELPDDGNAEAGHELDQRLGRLAAAVQPSSWWIVAVGQPGPQHTADWIHHGAPVTLRARITL